MSPSGLQEIREKGLCYTCDEKFIPGHKCKGKFFFIVHHEETNDDVNTEIDSVLLASEPDIISNNSDIIQNDYVDTVAPHIILHALVGNATTETLSINGKIKNKMKAVLTISSKIEWLNF